MKGKRTSPGYGRTYRRSWGRDYTQSESSIDLESHFLRAHPRAHRPLDASEERVKKLGVDLSLGEGKTDTRRD